MDTFLITGGAGFIGSRLARALVDHGSRVVVMDVLHPQVHQKPGRPESLPANVELWPTDVTCAADWDAALKLVRPDVVYHLAAETGTGQSLTHSMRHASVNVGGTAQMLDAFTRVGHVPRQLVLTSSRAVYGDGAWANTGGGVFYPAGRSRDALERGEWEPRGPEGAGARPLPSVAGSTWEHPISIYGATKLTQEHMLLAWSRAHRTRTTVLRLQNVYGPGQSAGNPYTGVLTFFARNLQEKSTLDVYEDGRIVRDFVHVDDVCAALVAASRREPAADEILDIGWGAPTTIHEVARMMARMVAAPEPHVSGRFRDGDVRAAFCSIEAARNALGYAPSVDLATGLRDLLRSFSLLA